MDDLLLRRSLVFHRCRWRALLAKIQKIRDASLKKLVKRFVFHHLVGVLQKEAEVEKNLRTKHKKANDVHVVLLL